MRIVLMIFAVLFAVITAVYVINILPGAKPQGALTILAHRGVHQRFSEEGLTNNTCTAARIFQPTHGFIENTIPSIRAAFDAGADIVEIDVHPTTDGEFIVFHDWGVDCRTEGKGVTRDLSLADIKKLDVGYGYTADGGKTFPFRGKGIGMAPSLAEVLAAFPGKRLWINGKSNDPTEADELDGYLRARPYAEPERLIFQMGPRPSARLQKLRPEAKMATRRSMLVCVRDYEVMGSIGVTPESCRNTVIFVPVNIGPILWGWPHRMLERMQTAGSDVVIVGAWSGGAFAGGLDDAAALRSVPKDWRGGVSTNAVEIIGPLVKE